MANKRLVKKKCVKVFIFYNSIKISGNKGGDTLTIYDNNNGTIKLVSGHCCVPSIDKTVPVEFLTAILSKVMLDYDYDINAVIDSFKWNEQFKTELKNKVR